MVLGSTQPLPEMSTGAFPEGRGGRCVRLTTLPPSCAVFMKFGYLNFLEPSGPLQACKGTVVLFYPVIFMYSENILVGSSFQQHQKLISTTVVIVKAESKRNALLSGQS